MPDTTTTATATPPATHAHIRWMIRRDLHEVLAIEHSSFPHPWSEPDFLHALRQRNCIGMVAHSTDGLESILGFMVYNLYPRHIEVLDFAVHPAHRRQGIGRQMVDKLVSKLSRHRRTRLLITVPETWLGQQLFFRDMGFLATDVMREACMATGEDVYLMEYELGGGPDEACEGISRTRIPGGRP